MPSIGIDLGGTKIFGVLLDGRSVVHDVKRKTPLAGGPPAVVEALAAVAGELAARGQVEALGVGAPGVVEAGGGVVRRAPNLAGWTEPFSLGPALSAALAGLPVVVENDVNAGTVAEHRLGAGRGEPELLGVFAGTGVGGGLVVGGRLRRGPTGLAGEIGHVVVERAGRPCGCGGRGHLEAYAGRAAMEARARELHAGGRETALVGLAGAKRMTSGVWAKGLAAGDPVAGELIDDAVDALGVAIASAVTLLDLGLVVVGGGLADRLGPGFVERVAESTRSRLFAGASPLRFAPAELGDRAGAIGAALLAGEGPGGVAAGQPGGVAGGADG